MVCRRAGVARSIGGGGVQSVDRTINERGGVAPLGTRNGGGAQQGGAVEELNRAIRLRGPGNQDGGIVRDVSGTQGARHRTHIIPHR